MMTKNSQLDRELVQYRQNFYRIYNSKILPILTEFEGKRKKNLCLIIVSFVLGITILVAMIALLLKCCFTDNPYIDGILFFTYSLIFIVGPLGGWFIMSVSSKFTKNLKISCMPKVTEAFGNMK